MQRWFCVACEFNQDALAELTIRADGWPVYRPLHLNRRSRSIEALFPGYLFVSFDREGDEWPRILRQRGVYRLLGSYLRPQPIPIGVIEALQSRTSARRVVDDPGQNASVVYLQPGTQARVLDGPLAGWDGVVTLSRADRIVLLMTLFGRPSEVGFKPTAVAPV